MSTSNVNRNPEADILSVVRDLDRSQASRPESKPDEAPEVSSADPAKLLDSLQKKRELIGLIDGYADVKGIDDMKDKLNEAIADLEDILEAAV